MQRQQMVVANRRRAEQRLKQVLAALARVKSGDYGFCLASDEPIGYARLKARPETPFSLEAQARIEAKGAGGR
jgi:DnaK suppressor protein